jgi:ribosomal protein L3 glutamine methyltransferase
MRIINLGCAAALCVFITGGAFAFDAAAPDDSTGASATKPHADDPGERSAKSIECSQKADAQNLHGKPRKHFMHECKHGGWASWSVSIGGRPDRTPAVFVSEVSLTERDERLELFSTPRDWLRYAIGRFRAANLAFGHGATTALDEAAYLILEGLNLPIDTLDPFLGTTLLRWERERLDALIEARVTTRKPAAYLLNRAYIRGVPFYVDERVIVPRSFIGELLTTAFAEENALTGDPENVGRALDLCTGGGSLAILAARVFPNARIEAVDLSPDALDVARRNVEEHQLTDRVRLIRGDLFEPLKDERYDLILANPPYVDAEALAEFPPEYAAEPSMAHAGGEDGLDIVRQILTDTPDHLTPEGSLVCEIGQGRDLLIRDFPELPFVWLDTEESAGEVFFLRAGDFATQKRRPSRKT